MENNPLLRPPSKRRQLIFSLIFSVVVCGLLYYLLCSVGPVLTYFDLDLGFLILPFLGFFILRFFSGLCTIYFSSQAGRTAAIILNAAAFSFFFYLFFSHAVLFTGIPVLADNQKVLTDFAGLAPYSVLFFIGYAVARFSALLTSTSFDRNSAPAVKMLGLLIIGISLWRASAVFLAYWSSASGLGLVFFIGMLAAAISNLGAYGQRSHNRLVADISGWVKASPVTKFLWGASISAYVIFILPVIESVSPYAHLITWLLVCLIAIRIFTHVRNGLQTNYTRPEKETEWEKHVQQVEKRIDEDYQLMTLFQSSFVAENDKEVMLSYLKKTLLNNHFSEDEISRMLGSLSEYRDRKVPWYAIGYWRKRIRQRNHQSRRQVLDEVISGLSERLRS